MSKLQDLSLKVAEHTVNLGENKEAAFDLSTIFLIAEIMTKFVELFKTCNKTPEEVVNKTKRPTFRDKLAARIMVRRSLGSLRDYREAGGNRLTEAFFQLGNNLTSEDVQELYDEV